MFNLKHNTFKMPIAFHYSIIWLRASLILRIWPLVTGALLIFLFGLYTDETEIENAAGKMGQDIGGQIKFVGLFMRLLD
jgi:hypothetical protein